MAHSIKINYILNLINNGAKLLFPIITFPYASRILEADGIGQIQFYISLITYIALFTTIGIPLYSVRQIARVKNDPKQTTILAVEILSLLGMLMLVGYVVVITISLTVPKVSEHATIFYILSSTLLFEAIGCEWFYLGREDFLYVTIRSIIVKSLAIVFLLTFVKTKQDLLYYAIYAVLSSIGGNFTNFIRLKKHINLESITRKDIKPFRHLKPALEVFAFSVVISIYAHMNTVFLGFLKTASDVGFYAVGIKVMKMLMDMCNSITTTILPRSSNLIAEKKFDEFSELIQKAYDFAFFLLLPLSFALMQMSPQMIRLLSGNGYEEAIIVSQIVSPLLFIVGLSCVFGSQALYPLGKINIMTKSSMIGAIIDLLLLLSLVPFLNYIGAAIAYLSAEIVVFFTLLHHAKKEINIKFWKNEYIHNIIATALMCIGIYLASLLDDNLIRQSLIMTIVGIAIYMTYMAIKKDKFVYMMIGLVFKKFQKKE